MLSVCLRPDVGARIYGESMPPAPSLPHWITRVGVFDLETTGIDVEKDRVVTAHVGLLDADGREIAARDWLSDPGVPIPEGATAVHGVTVSYTHLTLPTKRIV